MRAAVIVRETALHESANSIHYAAYGQNELASGELERIVQAVPRIIASALTAKVYYFVPLAMSATGEDRERHHSGGGEETMISPVFTPELRDEAICHRNVSLDRKIDQKDQEGEAQRDGVFISTRLLNDRFALAFEFFINVGHAYVEAVGVPEPFKKLLWEQALAGVRGETSQDAWESRNESIIQAGMGNSDAPLRLHVDERARGEFLEAAFSDALAIYLLSMSMDFNHSELREREYPLLAPQPLAERLRLAAKLFPPNAGYEFAIRYRKRA